MGYLPFGAGNKISPMLGFFTLGEMSVCFADRISPNSETSMQICLRAFSWSSYGSRNPSLWDSPTRSLLLCCRDFPSQSPHLMPHWWIFPIQNTNLAYGLTLS